ncbi:bifunctional Peptidase M24 [Babesia duncani]|uniref:Methionine aminopeptidase 2 n=1 Tax=Babesia duncani TaxID=323732 RepID=A0AAD9UNL8_9APIC|nr:bifunctional Peptidase M24 [Babesia duncani]
MESSKSPKAANAAGSASGRQKGPKNQQKKKKSGDDLDELELLKDVKIASTNPLLDGVQNPMPLRKLGKWTMEIPADIPVSKQFESNQYPLGEVMEYKEAGAYRMTNEEKRHLEKISEDKYKDLRRAAEVHRQVRRFIQSVIRPGVKMLDVVHAIEAKSKELIEADGLKCGWAFPTGCSLNECAAHYTPNYGDETVLQYGDICKIDFGTHVNGNIIDCAFTMAFDEQYDELIKATQEGTNTGLQLAGIDARISEIAEAIEEVIESHEATINAIAYTQVHVMINNKLVGKTVPIVKSADCHGIMEEGDLFAIETFASTGKGYVLEKMDCSHYMKNFDSSFVALPLKSSRELLKTINAHFGTLAFCKRWIQDITNCSNLLALKNLVDKGIVNPYPPLCDIKGSFTSQMEHTILLRPTCKEVLSRGDDY